MTGIKEISDQDSEGEIVRFVGQLANGEYVIERANGRLERRKSGTDWARLDALTDEEIEASIRDDPDWDGFRDIDWSDAVLVVPKKTPISIRVDDDVLNFFKQEGSGYQKRINAVLRKYMEQKTKKRA